MNVVKVMNALTFMRRNYTANAMESIKQTRDGDAEICLIHLRYAKVQVEEAIKCTEMYQALEDAKSSTTPATVTVGDCEIRDKAIKVLLGEDQG